MYYILHQLIFQLFVAVYIVLIKFLQQPLQNSLDDLSIQLSNTNCQLLSIRIFHHVNAISDLTFPCSSCMWVSFTHRTVFCLPRYTFLSCVRLSPNSVSFSLLSFYFLYSFLNWKRFWEIHTSTFYFFPLYHDIYTAFYSNLFEPTKF